MQYKKTIQLPEPEHAGGLSVEEAIFNRQSRRSFKDAPLKLPEISQILWAAGGKNVDTITGPSRTFPSAGGIYPQKFYLSANNIRGLGQGIYRYSWREHQLILIKKGNYSEKLSAAALGQQVVAQAPATIIITALYEKTAQKYGQRGEKYVLIDTGFAGENIYLQSESLGLATVAIGAFSEQEVSKILDLETTQAPLLIMPLGKK
ncbi:MAG: SagB/ThcOx family dehydrogenase [Candidatus Omnitrophica bacterium]|nr:SagB/ThcOx family dehydrogenase [Candidatus Omnitrophota bacterium]MCF7892199.1 SagB/ThcOx family dehydrogenase [Candidatus Omnitrophota bacterium]MCF7895468.1 SagB/ThcOx family dehydrogenase [Candidatus Omnitrophota bacterium]MCF7897848.1 SagB/ThcOx family dehydrogenase [Candidatus Omnitrophota bacterium]MCF7909714.1 SagB/ThcOx family dehydrogenase [Candidatus Omnitrophota bacterium]